MTDLFLMYPVLEIGTVINQSEHNLGPGVMMKDRTLMLRIMKCKLSVNVPNQACTHTVRLSIPPSS